MGTILFFEDDKDFANKTKTKLAKKLGSSVKVELANDILSKSSKEKTFVKKLYNDIKRVESVDLIVADVNLYETDGYTGLSAELVSDVGRRLFIPVCIYARKIPSDIDRIKESIDATIKLKTDPNSPQMITEIENLHDGFVKIKKAYKQLDNKMQSESLPRILSTILKKQKYVDRFSFYNLGNQEYLKYAPIGRSIINKKLRINTIPYILGHWLLLSILKFPGILLNEIATASYLNIAPNDFSQKKVKKLFQSALFKGPFAGIDNYWWRYELDEIIDKNQVNSGLDLARKKINKKIKLCKCTVDENLSAGYYCIVSKKPVSLEKSTSEISWIPKGADLARVSTPIYNKLKPWIGIL